jgi:hypothetical protein
LGYRADSILEGDSGPIVTELRLNALNHQSANWLFFCDTHRAGKNTS